MIPPPIAVWLDYLNALELTRLKDRLAAGDASVRRTIRLLTITRRVFRWNYDRLRRALGGVPSPLPDQDELKRLAAPYYSYRLDGGEGHMLVGKALYVHLHKQAHMTCELSPYSCMPNTMSVGAMSNVLGKYPDLLYAPIEMKGDAEVHALSRAQMVLTEAKKRAVKEFDDVLDASRVRSRGCAAACREGRSPQARRLCAAAPGRRRDRSQRGPGPGREAALICAIDVGSTTCKYLLDDEGVARARAYERHGTRQAEKVLEFLEKLEAEHGLTPGRDRVFVTGSGAARIAELVGGKTYQEVVAVSAAVERLHPDVRFVSEIGGEDMKTVFFTVNGETRSKQVMMQSACSGGTGTFVEKTARKLEIPPERLATMRYLGYTLHKLSSKCGIFAEADANTLVKAGVPNEEIVASLFEAVVYQNLATLTKGNTPLPRVLLLGGPNLFFQGLREAWTLHLGALWKERKVELPEGMTPEDAILVPEDALYYAALGCIELGRQETNGTGMYQGAGKLRWWIEQGQHEEKKKAGRQGLWKEADELARFKREFAVSDPGAARRGSDTGRRRMRLRIDHGQGRLHRPRWRDPPFVLRAQQGEPARGRQGAVPAGAGGGGARPSWPPWPSPATARTC